MGLGADEGDRATGHAASGECTALVEVGRTHLNALRWHEAVEAFTAALTIDGTSVEAARLLGDACQGAGMLPPAARAYRMALARQPQFPEALNSLGVVLFGIGELDEAAHCYARAMAARPDFVDPIANHGTLLKQRGDLTGALDAYDRALCLAPGRPELHYNRGNCLDRMGRLDEAIDAFNRALTLRPDLSVASWNRTLTTLSAGRLAEGWAQYERRWTVAGFDPPKVSYLQPRWSGEALAGRTLLLHTEQGLGDTIQFVRLASRVADAGGRVALVCQPSLVRLLRDIDGVAEVVAGGEPLPAHDFQLPLLSLCAVLGVTCETIPAAPYIHAVPAALPMAGGLRTARTQATDLSVGLVWAGSPSHANDANRSMTLAALSPLFDLPCIRFCSLQVGEGALVGPHPVLTDLAPSFGDFADTARAIAALDLVISVDTSVAHLAGAIGVPTLLLLAHHPDWRWMRQREDSPWYPSMRLIRQKRPGDWDGVVAEVKRELIGQLCERAAGDPGPFIDRALDRLGLADLEGAECCLALALRIRPDSSAGLNAFAALLEQRGDPAGALVFYDHLIERSPERAELHFDRGNCLNALDRLDASVAAFERALELRPGFRPARWNRTLALLAAGRLEQAWEGHEDRWAAPGFLSPPPGYAQPRWQGEPLHGRTILLHAEQGLGDTIQFIRYARLIAERGGRIVLRCQAALVSLMRTLPDLAEVVAFEDDLPPFDCYLPLLSAGCVFGTTLATVPGTRPYIEAVPASLPGGAAALRVGLVWAGGAAHPNDSSRSTSLAALEPLLGVPGALYYSLQVGPKALGRPHDRIIDLAPELTDFAATARVAAALDIVVAVDTAVAHLSGALGRDTLLLLPALPDWRWMREAGRTPWYPTVHLLRQPSEDAGGKTERERWHSPVQRARAALVALADAQGHAPACSAAAPADRRRVFPRSTERAA